MNKRVLVIGDAILDEYIKIDPLKVSDEAHVITSNVISKNYVLGGAANVARNICTMGGTCFFISSTSDSVNPFFLDLFKYYGIKYFSININNSIQIKTRIVSTRGSQICRYDSQFLNNPLNNEQIDLIVNKISDIINQYDVVVFSKYYNHFLTKILIDKILQICIKNNKLTIVDNRNDDFNLFSLVDFYKVNFFEFQQMYSGVNIKNEDLSIIETVNKFGFNFKNLIVTRSNLPTLIFSKNTDFYSHISVPVDNVEVKDVSGAGDTFVATFAINYDGDIKKTVEKCHDICNIVIKKMGTNVVWTYEMSDYENTEIIYKQLKQNGKKIVFTNGVFDILHTGHIQLLEECKKYGDYLIVGINSDNSVKKLKGKNRPINSELDRKKLLETIKYVDKVIIFDDLTCENIIKEIKPNIYVKGGDYNLSNLPERNVISFIDSIIFVDLLPNKSSTNIINTMSKK